MYEPAAKRQTNKRDQRGRQFEFLTDTILLANIEATLEAASFAIGVVTRIVSPPLPPSSPLDGVILPLARLASAIAALSSIASAFWRTLSVAIVAGAQSSSMRASSRSAALSGVVQLCCSWRSALALLVGVCAPSIANCASSWAIRLSCGLPLLRRAIKTEKRWIAAAANPRIETKLTFQQKQFFFGVRKLAELFWEARRLAIGERRVGDLLAVVVLLGCGVACDRRPLLACDRRPLLACDRRPLLACDRRPLLACDRRPILVCRRFGAAPCRQQPRIHASQFIEADPTSLGGGVSRSAAPTNDENAD